MKKILFLVLSFSPLTGCSPTINNEEKIFTSGEILNTESQFHLQAFKNLGWKPSKKFPKDSLQGSPDVWYGFFNRKDIELRIYSNHEDLLGIWD